MFPVQLVVAEARLRHDSRGGVRGAEVGPGGGGGGEGVSGGEVSHGPVFRFRRLFLYSWALFGVDGDFFAKRYECYFFLDTGLRGERPELKTVLVLVWDRKVSVSKE